MSVHSPGRRLSRSQRSIGSHHRKPGGPIDGGSFESVETEQLEVMNLTIPTQVPGVDSKYLNPAKTWRNTDSYWQEATRLARLFDDNIRHYGVPEQILGAGPRVHQKILD